MIDYKTNTATKDDLYLHFQKCDSQFIPALSERVNLKNYAKKLCENAELFEAWHEFELVGVFSVYLNNKESKIGFISNVSVLTNYVKKGLASQLLKQVVSKTIKLDFLELMLEVHSINNKAIMFYTKYGFKIISKKKEVILMSYKINN